ncbi:hypothetical protein GCM10011575_24460 [Microlunatus endophyticus]|uniref:Uncharacterized protein n=1 Tax=Microlunatus endophyticus TaxID=1716077 RepID=A0A917SAY6_9ACTN|nr:hypothetical protein GCM10011575_24460 [Microlunatus endophyticus]
MRVAIDQTRKHRRPSTVDHKLITHRAQTGTDLGDDTVLHPDRIGGHDLNAIEDPDLLKKK